MIKDYIFTGKTIDEAIVTGCKELGIERDDVSVEVLETPSRSFLGLKVIPAKVKLSVDVPEPKVAPKIETAYQQQRQPQPQPQRNPVPQPQRNPVPQPKPQQPQQPQQQHIQPQRQEMKKEFVKPEPPKETRAPQPQPPRQEQRQPAPHQESQQKAPRAVVSEEDLNAAGKNVSRFLSEVMGVLDIGANVDLKVEQGVLNAELAGNNMGIIIGRRGETLDSLQYLASLVANKGHEEYIKVNLDTENYRQKREASLTTLAHKVAAKVEKNQKSVTLEPMNPYERRIIHSVLQENSNVVTASVGVEPNRKVVVHPAGAAPSKQPQNRYHKNRRPYHKPQSQPQPQQQQ